MCYTGPLPVPPFTQPANCDPTNDCDDHGKRFIQIGKKMGFLPVERIPGTNQAPVRESPE